MATDQAIVIDELGVREFCKHNGCHMVYICDLCWKYFYTIPLKPLKPKLGLCVYKLLAVSFFSHFPSFALCLFSSLYSSSLIHTAHEVCTSWGHAAISRTVVFWLWAEWLFQTLHHKQKHTFTQTYKQTQAYVWMSKHAGKLIQGWVFFFFFFGPPPQLYMHESL